MTYRSRPFSKITQALTQAPAKHAIPAVDQKPSLPRRPIGAPRPWRPLDQTLVLPPLDSTTLPPSQLGARVTSPRMDAVRAAEKTAVLPAVAAPGSPTGMLPVPALPHAEVEQFQTQVLPAINALHHEQASAPSGHYRSVEEIERSLAMWVERNNRWLDDNSWLEARKQITDRRMAEFYERWKYVDEGWDKLDAAWRARHEDAVFGEELLTEVYGTDGTAVVLGMVDELARQIALNAVEKSARAELEVSR